MYYHHNYECVRKDIPDVLPDDLKNIVVEYARFIPRPSSQFYKARKFNVLRNFIHHFKEDNYNSRFLNKHVIPLFCVAHYNKNPNWHQRSWNIWNPPKYSWGPSM